MPPGKVLDPMGAIIVRELGVSCRPFFFTFPAQIATGVSGAWFYRIYLEFELLAGKSAPHEFIQLLTYNAMTFSSEIEKIDTVRAYHVSCRPIWNQSDGFSSGFTPIERSRLFRRDRRRHGCKHTVVEST